MKSEKQIFTDFIKAVALTVKQFRLYAQEHPIAKQAVESLGGEIKTFFAQVDEITIGSMHGRLVVNGAIASDKDSAATDLAKELDRVHVEGIVMHQGVTLDELRVFLKLLSERPKTLDGLGGFKKAFEDKKFKFIQLSSGTFQLVEEGQTVAGEDEFDIGLDGAPEALDLGEEKSVKSISDIIQKIRQETQAGHSSHQKIDLNAPEVVEQIEKKPQEIVDAALAGDEDAVHLESVIRNVVKSLVKGLVTYLADNGKDITKALLKLSKELEKSIKKMGKGEEFDRLAEKIPNLFEEESDELRIQMMLKIYQDQQSDPKAIEKLAHKLFKDEKIRKRVRASVQQELIEAGMSADAASGMFENLEEKISKKKKKVTIDADELKELRRQAALGGDGDVQTQIKAAVAKVEREKKILQGEKERVDAVVRNLSEGVMVVDKNGKVVMMNPAAEKLLGIKASEKMGEHVSENLSEGQMVAMTKGDLRGQGDHVAKNVEVISFDDDARKVLQASTAVIENEDGQTVGMVSVLSDITKQKEVEELKSKFVSNVSHELRTPLAAIQKSLNVVMGEELGAINEEQGKFLALAHRNIERLTRLINDLLDVSKLEAKGMSIKPRSVSICDLSKQVLATLETWAKDKKVKLLSDFEDPDITAEVDSDRIIQVLTNLASNALKFTPENGSVTIDIKKVFEKGEDFVEVGVNDTGIGIAPEDQQRIFDKFVQISLAQPQGVPSTGLGLTITKEIVELHSGEIWVDSLPDKGSRFAFRIPVVFKKREEV